MRGALHQAEQLAVAEAAARLADNAQITTRLDALVLTQEQTAADVGGTASPAGEPEEESGQDTEEDAEEDVESVLGQIKAHPGNVSLSTLLDEESKLREVRAVGVPADAFAGLGPQVVDAWRARAAASSPSHLRRFEAPVRRVLLAALLFQREREITDTLVELSNSTVHRINARAEAKVTDAATATTTPISVPSQARPET